MFSWPVMTSYMMMSYDLYGGHRSAVVLDSLRYAFESSCIARLSFCQFLPVKTVLNRQMAKTSFCRQKCQPWAERISAARRLELSGMTVRRATMSIISAWKSAVECVSLASYIRPLDFCFWISPRNASEPVLPRLSKTKKQKEEKTPVSAISVTLFHRYLTRPL